MTWARNSRGAITPEMAVLAPLAILLAFGGAQEAMLAHARTIATAAAQNGARAAAFGDGTLTSAITAATDFTQLFGQSALHDVQIEGTRSPTTVTITVKGRSAAFFPGLPTQVEQTITLPVERITR